MSPYKSVTDVKKSHLKLFGNNGNGGIHAATKTNVLGSKVMTMLNIKKIFSEHSLKNVKPFITGTREPFFQMAKDYVKPESAILDIGSGEGNFVKFLGRKDVYMIDGNQATVELLKKEFENIYYGKLPELPFEDNKFDVIHTSHLVEHLTPQELYDLLKEIDRCLKNGGVLVISTPLLWTGFYWDMSHLKPYYPGVFINYLSSAGHNRTKSIISSKYKVVKTQYRYGYNHSHLKSYYFIRNNILNIICYIVSVYKDNAGVSVTEFA